MQQSWKVLWVVLRSLCFKEIWKNGARGHRRMFAPAKGEQQRKFWQLQCLEPCISGTVYNLIISHITFQDRHIHIFADNLSCIYGIHVSARLVYIKSKIPCHSNFNQTLGEVFHSKFFKTPTLVPCSLSKRCTQLHQCMDSESCGSLF